MLHFQKPKNIGSLTSILLVLIKKKECTASYKVSNFDENSVSKFDKNKDTFISQTFKGEQWNEVLLFCFLLSGLGYSLFVILSPRNRQNSHFGNILLTKHW